MPIKCLICKRGVDIYKDGTDTYSCPTCGMYKTAVSCSNPEIPQDIAYKFSAYTRALSDQGEPAIITPRLMAEIRLTPDLTFKDKEFKLLRVIRAKTSFFGQGISFNWIDDYSLIHAKNPEEFLNFISLAEERKEIKRNAASLDADWIYSITVDGFEKLEDQLKTNSNSKKAFVAMSFSSDLDSMCFDQIFPAIQDAVYDPKRIDLKEHNGLIVGEIFAEIRQSRFVVADFTGHKNGVYFEAGFALGAGIPVIWLCKKNQIVHAHFDTNHFNHLLWNDGDDLRRRLELRILETIGAGVLRKACE